MPNTRNEESLNNIKDAFGKANSSIFIDYSKLTSNQINELRSVLSEVGAKMTVAKNTLLNIALGGKEKFEGQTAVIFGLEDSLSPIKALFEFIKDKGLPQVKLGLMDGNYLSTEEVAELSKIPSRGELYARVVGGFNTPVSGFVNVLGGTISNFVRVIGGVAKNG